MAQFLTAFITVALLLSVGDPVDAAETDDSFEPVTAVFRCVVRERSFLVATQTTPSGLYVFIPQPFEPRTVHLGQVESASGARYEGEGISAGTKAGTAMFVFDGVRVAGCRLDRKASVWEAAKLDGADFRAIGNEPGWVLEIRERNKLVFDYDYDRNHVEAFANNISTDQSTRQTMFVADSESGVLRVTLTGEVCLDSVSGEAYETTVLVEYLGVSYPGCGRPLH